MASNKVRKFREIWEVQLFLNGGIIGGSVVAGKGQGGNPGNLFLGVQGLVGKTLIFSEPASGTVTFSASTQSGNPDPNTLMPSDIKAQIETVMSGVTVSFQGGVLVIVEATPDHGVAISKTGTANALLGFDATGGNDTIGLFYPPPSSADPPTAPYWTWAYSTNDNMHVIFTYE